MSDLKFHIPNKKSSLDFTTKIASFDTNTLGGHHLAWGCPVSFQNELLIFGVNKASPSYSSVSFKQFLIHIKSLHFSFILIHLRTGFSDSEIDTKLQIRVPASSTEDTFTSWSLCYGEK